MTDTTSYPYRTIVRITDQIGGMAYQFSGVLIAADEVLTASHAVWTTGVGVATNVRVTAGANGTSAPYGTVSGTVTHYNPINDSNDNIALSDIPNDYALIHLSAPLDVGTMAIGTSLAAGPVVVSGYPGTAGGQQVNQVQQVTAGSGVLLGQSIGAGSSGGPVWTNPFGSPEVDGLVSASSSSGTGYFVPITIAVHNRLLDWLAADEGLTKTVSYTVPSTGQTGAFAMDHASGGPNYLQWQYIWAGSQGVSMATAMPNSFLHGGAGDDAIVATSGRNVLDGGPGSNFLVGGTGADTFFTDARAAVVVWNTVVNFHAGDAATLWGFSTGVSSYRWDDLPAGASGSTGATLRANIVGGAGRTGNGIDASITFAGLTVAQGKQLQVSTGTQAAGPYLSLYNSGV